MTAISVRATVIGRVQGVWFRAWTQREARKLGLAGWVRNCDDGSVEVLAEGPEAEVRALIAALHDGPPAARVAEVSWSETRPDGLSGFDIRD